MQQFQNSNVHPVLNQGRVFCGLKSENDLDILFAVCYLIHMRQQVLWKCLSVLSAGYFKCHLIYPGTFVWVSFLQSKAPQYVVIRRLRDVDLGKEQSVQTHLSLRHAASEVWSNNGRGDASEEGGMEAGRRKWREKSNSRRAEKVQEGGSERKAGSKRSGKREATQVEHSRMKMSPGRLLINYRPLSLCFHARWDLFFCHFN